MLRITQNLLLLTVIAFPGLSDPPIVHAQSASSGSISGQSQPSSVKSRVPTRTSIRYGSGFFADKSPKTALDMVNLLPGFTFSLGDTSIRGYAAAAGNVLIDGERPSEKQLTLDTVLQQIPVSRVAYIEVITGPDPDLEMLGQPVVANVVLKTSTATSTVVTLADGFFLDGRNTPSGSVQSTRHASGGRTLTGAVSASQYVELAEGKGPQTRRDLAGNALNTVSVDSAAGGLTAYAYGVFSTPAWKGQLSINGSAARTDYAYREQDSTTFPTASSSNLHEYLGGPLGGQLVSELGVHFNRNFRGKLESESVVLFDPTQQTYSSHVDSPGIVELFQERQHGGEALGRTNLRYTATPKLTIEGSAEVTYNWLSTASSYLYNSVPVPLPNALATVTEIRDQFLGHITWSFHNSFTLDVGTQVEDSTIASRADVTQSKSLNYFKPRVAFNYSAHSNERFSLRVEHEVGQLNFADFVAVSSLDTGSILAGNTDIVPQQDWVFEATNENHFWSEGDLALTYRHYLIADTLDRVPIYNGSNPTAVFDAPGNIGSGTEDAAIMSLTLPTDRLRIKQGQLKVIGTRLWSSVNDPTTGKIRPISGLKPFEYSFSFRQNLPRWRADWGASFLTPCFALITVKGCTESEYRFNEIDNYRATPTVNLFAEYEPSKTTSLRIEADNVLQQRYNRVVTIYAGPRNTFPLSYQDDRSLTSSASLVLSLRKTF